MTAILLHHVHLSTSITARNAQSKKKKINQQKKGLIKQGENE